MQKLLFIIICSTMLLACKKQDDVTVSFTIKTTNKTPNNRPYQLSVAKTKILFSNFVYVDKDNNEVLVKDVFLLTSAVNNFQFKFPGGNFTKFKFSFGLDSIKNNSVPASFPASSPLSVETGLYWDMLKYRFLILEGNIDNSVTKNQTPNTPFSMHIGSDTLYQQIVASNFPKIGEQLNITLDLDKLFVLDNDNFQITNFSNHSEASEIAKGIAIRNSFVNSIQTTITPKAK
ncbi:MAG TPA: hypothetical protein PK431_01185 [Chitinophagales bacterium]|nr:hypothetical protein [Chitinophagales bacterium]